MIKSLLMGLFIIQYWDKIIYKELGKVKHSLTVANVGEFYEAYGKGGNQPRPYLQSIRYGWQSQEGNVVTMGIYRKMKKW